MIGLQACQLSMLDKKKNMLGFDDISEHVFFIRGGEIMSKSLSLFFAVASIVLMLATAFSISNNGWLALLFGVSTLAMIAFGFVIKVRLRRKSPNP